jgi:hypothetical protein
VSELVIRVRDVYRKPLGDRVDVTVTAHRTGRLVGQAADKPGTATIRVPDLVPTEVYVVRVFPSRHRAVGHFIQMSGKPKRDVEIICPADSKRVLSIVPPPFSALTARARAILEASALEHPPTNTSGQSLYDSAELSFAQKAGLLNLLAKTQNTPLPDGSTVLDHVDSFYRVRGDRVFANVALALRDLVKTGVASQLFSLVDGSLHKPDPDFHLVDSYKTPDRYGNLQITFFASLNPPLRFTADIDIDDAQGIGHIFQVVEHAIAKTMTNPYDIHEILIHHQFLDPGYELVLA